MEALDVEEFTTSLRRRKQIAGAIGLIVVVLVGAFLAIQASRRLPALDPKTVDDVRQALDQIPAEYRSQLAARALVELEGERLPAALLRVFAELSSAPPGMGDLVLLAPFAADEETLRIWLRACPDGAAILADAAREGGAAAVYERCELDRLGLLADTELGGVSVGELVATHSVWAYLVDHDSETDIERRVLRTIMGRR